MKDLKHLRRKIENEIRLGYIRRSFHPQLGWSILNYTPKCQHEWRWNEMTTICRGLMIDKDWNIVGRAFDKFFTPDQCVSAGVDPPYSDPNFVIFDKLDGVLYEVVVADRGDGKIEMISSTRGSFDNEWITVGNNVLVKKYTREIDLMKPGYTYCFELLTQRSRENGLTVVDYGKEDDVRLLAVIDTETGLPVSYELGSIPSADLFPPRSIESLIASERDNAEGFVVYWPDQNFRLKIKLAEYVKIHRLLALGTYKRVYDMLTNGDTNIMNAIRKAPVQVRRIVMRKVYILLIQFHYLMGQAYKSMEQLMESEINLNSRKEVAQFFNSSECEGVPSPILFNLYDQRDPTPSAWKIIKKISKSLRANEEDEGN